MDRWAGLALLLVVTAGVWWPQLQGSPPPAAARWEYAIEPVGDATWTADMNAQGANGWELVAARRATTDDPSQHTIYECIFKRPAR